jgi:hypothetical protein
MIIRSAFNRQAVNRQKMKEKVEEKEMVYA